MWRFNGLSLLSLTVLQMILVALPSKPFEYTSKGNLRRQRMIDAYATEINALYDSVAESAQEDVIGPSEWNAEQTHEFVKSVVARTLKTRSENIEDGDGLFEHGLDRYASRYPSPYRQSDIRCNLVSRLLGFAILSSGFYVPSKLS